MPVCRLFAISAVACLAPASLLAQPIRALAKPDAEFAEPFTNLTAIRELKDGRVIAIDPRDKSVMLIDFARESPRKIGREGSGPKEYGLPMALLALPGDSSAIFDPLNSRLMLITPGGEAGEFARLPSPSSQAGPGGGMMISMTAPRYTDSRGRFYTLGSAVRMGPDGPISADSQPILRLDRAASRTDTLGWLRQPKENMQASGTSGRQEIRIGMANPFVARDEWVVTPDGRVGIIRSPEYRLDWVSPAKATGSPIAYQKLRVTEAHKQQWRDSRRGATAIMITNNNGNVQTRAGAPGSGGITIPEPSDWPELLPPFLGSGGAIFPAPDGRVWVTRTREGNDNVPKYDVLDAAGQVAMRVTLPPKTRLVGLGNGTVYTVRTDEDDLQYLQRHRLR